MNYSRTPAALAVCLLVGLSGSGGFAAPNGPSKSSGAPNEAKTPPKSEASGRGTPSSDAEPSKTPNADPTKQAPPSGRLRAAVAVTPADRKTAVAFFKRGQAHYFKKNFYTARQLFARAVRLDPEHRDAHAYLGDVYLVQRKPDPAIEHIRIAIELSSDSAREYFRLGQAYYLKKDPARALEAYGAAYKADPDLHAVLFQTGLVRLYLLADRAGTIKDWSEFRRLAPDDPQGPAIDRALALLRDPNFQLPTKKKDCPKCTFPKASDSEAPNRPPPSTEKKDDKRGDDIIPVDDL